ncbi:acyl carrier protein [Paenibacillus shirakamiensis]|uniref:Acyl carrier protein n=1 Tax=Paenibacillus shirakamiensis TaxID=1265935 RepID=A0ABS4JHR8_9BACL|nr:acyl carrier protein [Paenibacillus shirakamiensis]MBP2000605.1 acyl carrier protein [Paenibacillus shirakamiensis]
MATETREELKERIIEMLKENLEGASEMATIDPDTDLSTLGINSMTFIKLVIATEMEFGVSWSDEDLDFRNFRTVNHIMNYITESKVE